MVLRLFRSLFCKKPTEHRHMKLIETLRLDEKNRLMLVACDRERFLVGVSGHSQLTILNIDHHPIVEDLPEFG